MTPEERDYVRYRMADALETLDEARLLLANRRTRGAVNRLYYACLYLVSALLMTERLRSTKHTGIRSLFFRHWIKTGRLPVEMGEFYQRLFDRRQKGDYDERVRFNPIDVEAWIGQATTFVARINEELERILRLDEER